MRPSQSQRPGALTTAIASLLLWSAAVSAVPYPKDDLHDSLGSGYLMDRGCEQYCGYNNMYCCSGGQQCYTSNGIAGCSNAAAGGGYALYTTTWTETETFTSTMSSYFPAATAPAAQTCVPEAGSGQIACGNICCASWQYCAWEGQCYPNGGAAGGGGSGGGGATYTTVITTGGATITTQYSAPYRVTSGPSATQTSTVTGALASATTTGNGTISAGGTSGHLSGGAIAGIVIGVIAGIGLLLLLCFYCIVRGLWHTVVAIFGGGRKPRGSRETIIEEERYTRHGSVHSRRDAHAGWFGGRGGRPSTVAESRRASEKKSGGSGWLGLGAAVATLLLLLGLRRDKKRRAPQPRSDVSSSYFSDSYTATSPRSGSSRRTRDTRRSRRTEATRISRASRHG